MGSNDEVPLILLHTVYFHESEQLEGHFLLQRRHTLAFGRDKLMAKVGLCERPLKPVHLWNSYLFEFCGPVWEHG